MLKILSLFFLLFLLFPQKTLAALSITDVSPLEINSSNDAFTVSVSASSLQSNPQYLQLALTSVNPPTNLFGITVNSVGDPYIYKSSPTFSDLETTFYKFSHENGSWSGQISGKIDISDKGYIGPGQYNLRLYKYTISSTGNVSSSPYATWSSPMTINVSISPTPTSTLTTTPSPTPVPTTATTPTPKPATPKPSTPKPTVASTPTPTPKATAISISLGRGLDSSESSKDILGSKSAVAAIKPSPKPQTKTLVASENNISKILIGLGAIILLSGVGIYIKSLKR